ncbi:MoxR family ATPase [Riemerella anatipestifer]|uniref:ATPase associated with various cellular activities AAA_3 n=1 Tax=Riemerella anatipestifer (strain ATCC 11845 / DSM 15868 / JCM 9532 / NCTC 11014) TaxID=693978 RepID=E4TDR4_RIEAD|nr:MoxR family ATPase [Riemerella anatipestifer]ADQ82923.1 ATPase associated with various cellular activities AAA_3 [Riemerella anatipestifer ATCC 11845 = DSM 15868]ADZ11575.1 MoxR-like ATPase [Riemerella anatipestifer RA-GD]AFD56935.1 ATPase associated with various cellular activities AAA_3 [Riemerella anatipestifer ATCC 11845 = DSM 15868]AKP70086.1 ATPase [Riemerella anatipestifer]AKQ40522.1 ATPase [Riemerella anatipestifer Yb2]
MAELHQAEEIKILTEQIQVQNYHFKLLKEEMGKVVIGQSYMVDRLLVGLLGNGHILLEGVPGLAKTLAIKTLSEALQGQFSRIQFTPDLLPADVVGTMIYNVKENDFSIKKGPVFANFVLADEINRAPAKVQSALLEVMQEKQVTIGDETLQLPKPFLVMATQNPIDQEGTYLLPEAQTDRFMLKCKIEYPEFEDERAVMRMVSTSDIPKVTPVVSLEQISEAKQLINKIYLDEKIEKYILDMVFATRFPERYGLSDLKDYISFGASPRASIGLAVASRAIAFIKGRAFVIPEDVKEIAKDVLRHRIGLSFEAEAENITTDEIVDRVLARVQAP